MRQRECGLTFTDRLALPATAPAPLAQQARARGGAPLRRPAPRCMQWMQRNLKTCRLLQRPWRSSYLILKSLEYLRMQTNVFLPGKPLKFLLFGTIASSLLLLTSIAQAFTVTTTRGVSTGLGLFTKFTISKGKPNITYYIWKASEKPALSSDYKPTQESVTTDANGNASVYFSNFLSTQLLDGNFVGLFGDDINPDSFLHNAGTVNGGPVNVPAPLPLMGLGAFFGYSRKLRKRLKTSKTPEVISAIT